MSARDVGAPMRVVRAIVAHDELGIVGHRRASFACLLVLTRRPSLAGDRRAEWSATWRVVAPPTAATIDAFGVSDFASVLVSYDPW